MIGCVSQRSGFSNQQQMRNLILMAHISLDGFVASPDGKLDGFRSDEENLEFVCRICQEADAALFGRISYQLLHDFWPTAKDRPQASRGEIDFSAWYNRAQKLVISRTLINTKAANTVFFAENVIKDIIHLKHQQGKSIVLFGSPSVAQLMMQNDLIDTYWIFINPAIFGKGIPLFKELKNPKELALMEVIQFANGELAVKYSNPMR